MQLVGWCFTQHNTTQHNTTQHNTTQHNTTQHNTTQQSKHIVNVSAMEGKFYRHKTPFHPHTVCLSLSVLNEIEPHADLMHWCDV
jgi:hypothetical protein